MSGRARSEATSCLGSVCACVCVIVREKKTSVTALDTMHRERIERQEKMEEWRKARHITQCNAPINCIAACSNDFTPAEGKERALATLIAT